MSQVKAIAEAAGEHIAGVRQINVNNATDLSRTTVAREDELALAKVATAGPMPIKTSAGDQDVAVSVTIVAAAK